MFPGLVKTLWVTYLENKESAIGETGFHERTPHPIDLNGHGHGQVTL